MIPPIDLFNSDYCKDVLSHTLSFLETATNIETTPWVCKKWNLVAKQVVKCQILFREKNNLAQKMAPFLTMMGRTVDDYCPAFEEMRKNLQQFSPNEIISKSCALTEKHSVVLRESFSLDPCSVEKGFETIKERYSSTLLKKQTQESKEINQQLLWFSKLLQTHEKVNKTAGKAFIRLDIIYESGSGYQQWSSSISGFSFFPIALFDLKLEGASQELLRENATGRSYCFPIDGKLTEFSIIPSTPIFDPLLETVPAFPVTMQTAFILPGLCDPTLDTGVPTQINHS